MVHPYPSFEPIKAPGSTTTGQALLDSAGARVVLGWSAHELAVAIAPTPQHLFGPRGVCLHTNGSLWVADTGHHRLLGWHQLPERDNQPADILIGQPDFHSEGRNAKSNPTCFSCNVPTGLSPWGRGLALADPWNHRVLLWKELPQTNNQPADIVLGQADGQSMLANRGKLQPDADTLHWCYGVSEVGGKLAVCDTGNRRVLIWENPRYSGQAADWVLGQTDFTTRDENAGGDVSAMSMRWPHQVLNWAGRLAVTDAGNNRIMLWNEFPETPGAACDLVLGQQNMQACDHNMAAYYPSASSLNMPYAIAESEGALLVADSANSRLLGFTLAETAAPARYLAAQLDFACKGDNRWGLATRDSLCWPYGLAALGNTVAIADSGNNRVLIWDRTS